VFISGENFQIAAIFGNLGDPSDWSFGSIDKQRRSPIASASYALSDK
jgi:hypothetical protein